MLFLYIFFSFPFTSFLKGNAYLFIEYLKGIILSIDFVFINDNLYDSSNILFYEKL